MARRRGVEIRSKCFEVKVCARGDVAEHGKRCGRVRKVPGHGPRDVLFNPEKRGEVRAAFSDPLPGSSDLDARAFALLLFACECEVRGIARIVLALDELCGCTRRVERGLHELELLLRRHQIVERHLDIGRERDGGRNRAYLRAMKLCVRDPASLSDLEQIEHILHDGDLDLATTSAQRTLVVSVRCEWREHGRVGNLACGDG